MTKKHWIEILQELETIRTTDSNPITYDNIGPICRINVTLMYIRLIGRYYIMFDDVRNDTPHMVKQRFTHTVKVFE